MLTGQYKGKGGKTIFMEAVVDLDLYIWYFNFGAAGSLNISIVCTLLPGEFDIKLPAYEVNCKLRY